MRVTSSTFTIAEYCNQMMNRDITVNRGYQRSSKVWPAAARSFLIDSILNGFPIPKLSLFQKSDLKSRKTIKEIVDGQQRSHAILDFFNDQFRISYKGSFTSASYSTLTTEQQQHFLDYPLSVDIFVDSTDSDIRELFRRVNSYNVPLNSQEKRHSTYQGAFKWFIYAQSTKYAQLLKDFGTFNESQISRMEDSRFIADLCVGFEEGLISASESKIDKLYTRYDNGFDEELLFDQRLSSGFDFIIQNRDVLGDELNKKYHLYCLILAYIHKTNPIETLNNSFPVINRGVQNIQLTRENISRITEAVASNDNYEDPNLRRFIEASQKTTDRQIPRTTRFEILLNSLV